MILQINEGQIRKPELLEDKGQMAHFWLLHDMCI
jgi:hypothetical protein